MVTDETPSIPNDFDPSMIDPCTKLEADPGLVDTLALQHNSVWLAGIIASAEDFKAGRFRVLSGSD